ncbi:hypothetical protein PUN28_006504 [Cardiocondyla obscurior]|uniref:Uncharacterized protein n=2 Tax=Cardiocondyla obscurior TaxID=286306 RepID=A0AAW2GDS0_9HYME
MRKIFVIIFVTCAITARCRSVALTNEENTAGEKNFVNTPEQLKKLITLYEENFGRLVNFVYKMSRNKDSNKQENQHTIQLLNQLSSFIAELVEEQSKAINSDLSMKINDINNIQDLINIIKEIDIVYQDGEITGEHVRIKRAAEGYKSAASFATEERMTNVLIDIQHQVVQIRKHLDKLCKKHYSTSAANFEVNPGDDIFSDQPKNDAAM